MAQITKWSAKRNDMAYSVSVINSLPTDILFLIADQLDFNDLAHLCLLSKSYHHFFTPLLWKRAVRICAYFKPLDSINDRSISGPKTSLKTNPYLWALSHTCLSTIQKLLDHGLSPNLHISEKMQENDLNNYNNLKIRHIPLLGFTINCFEPSIYYPDLTSEHITIISHLLKAGANPTIKSSSLPIPIPLLSAAISFHSKTDPSVHNHLIKELLLYGAPVSGIDQPALHLAAMVGIVPIAKLFLEHGADTNALLCPFNRGRSTLHSVFAARKPHRNTAELARLFISRGALVNAMDEEGNTPLHLAVRQPYNKNTGEGVEVLLRYGARVDVRNKDGETPMDFVSGEEFRRLLEIIPGNGEGYDTLRCGDSVGLRE
ncbi:ankyrin repeat-containing domain protein [Pyronema omphalodes]|nr:ankyrin repeat-containing domain protein [Pyronema omphalodes]